MKKLVMYVAFAVMAAGGAASAQNQNITLEDIWTKRTFAPKGIGGIRSMQDGVHYLSMTRTGIAKYSYLTGEKVEDLYLFQTPDSRKLAKPVTPMEGYEMSADEQKVLLSSGFEPIYRHSGVSDYWIYDLQTKTLTKLSKKGKQRLTTLSPDGTKVAFVRDNNLYWMDLATLEEHAITTDGKQNSIIYGTTDWVYEEEFAITQGFAWSPDSKKIAFYRFDESRVKEYNMQMWGQLYPEDYRYKYPKAGEDNSVVEMCIYSLETQKVQKPNLGTVPEGLAKERILPRNQRPLDKARRDSGREPAVKASKGKGRAWEYLPRFQWTNNANVLAVMRMNRLQNHMQILTVDATTLETKTLYEEIDKAYVEVPDTWQFIQMGKGKKVEEQMLVTSEKDGYRHIYLYGMDGQLVKQVTSGEWEVADVCGVDEKNQRLYYTSREDGAINQSLYMTGFDGKGKKCLNHNGKGTYSAKFSNGCKYYICTWSDANHAPVYTLHDASGKQIKVLQDNAELQKKMADYGTGHKVFGTFKTSTGTELNYYTITPKGFDPQKQGGNKAAKKYPVLFYVYGGPGNQQVSNSYGGSDYYWYHMLAEKGYVVVCFDGRGTGGRGAAFKKQTYKDLGRMECEDAIEAAHWFGQQKWVDASRIGIWGWSFGGYLSTLALLKGNDVFKSAVAVAPVMNWRYYDNIYTERFLALPQDNAKGYDNNSPLNFADRLKGNYLLIHGTGDDNVHFQNSAEMVEKLEEAGKQFEFRIYPNKNHSIYDATGNTRLNLYQLMTDFIMRKL